MQRDIAMLTSVISASTYHIIHIIINDVIESIISLAVTVTCEAMGGMIYLTSIQSIPYYVIRNVCLFMTCIIVRITLLHGSSYHLYLRLVEEYTFCDVVIESKEKCHIIYTLCYLQKCLSMTNHQKTE